MIDKHGVERCDYIHAHADIIEKVTSEMPEEEVLYDLAELFKIFGDSTRIKSSTSCSRRKCAPAGILYGKSAASSGKLFYLVV